LDLREKLDRKDHKASPVKRGQPDLRGPRVLPDLQAHKVILDRKGFREFKASRAQQGQLERPVPRAHKACRESRVRLDPRVLPVRLVRKAFRGSKGKQAQLVPPAPPDRKGPRANKDRSVQREIPAIPARKASRESQAHRGFKVSKARKESQDQLELMAMVSLTLAK
jgi:hypothetical protein